MVQVVGGRFEVRGQVGAGGMGVVYAASDRATGARVAVKVLGTPRSASERALFTASDTDGERFAREARLLAQIDHPAIVRYVAHGTTDEGAPYLAMEWLEGETLDARLARGKLAVREARDLGTRLADALGCIHAAGFIHRDVKPSNVMLVGGLLDRAKLIDFGIARASEAPTDITLSGARLGTLRYMAPEQARGDAPLDMRADIFALGAVLFEALTARPAFDGATPAAILGKLLLEAPPPLGLLRDDIPPELEELIAQMLEKAPEARPRGGAEVAAALRTIDLAPLTVRAATALTEAERRVVSVVAVSSRGSTPERRAAMRAAASPFGAQLAWLPDGTLIAVLASPSRATDQAARSARCALALMDAAPGARLVLVTGRAEVTGHARAGEAIDRATELLATARADARWEGRIRVDEVTHGLLHAGFVTSEADGQIELCAQSGEAPPRRLLGRETPCVGRGAELALLATALGSSVERPAPGCVVVTGEAGVGKSRLAHELVLEARRRGASVWLARGDSLSAGAPFGLVGSAIRHASGVVSGMPEDERRRRVEDIARARVAHEDARRVAEFLGEIAGVPFPGGASQALRAARRNPTAMGDQMRRAWEDLVRAAAGTAPLVLVVEDLHWGDAASVRLIDGALGHARGTPFFVLALARPSVREVFSDLWPTRDVLHVPLARLGDDASAALVRNVLGGDVAADVVARVVERADGNAFFLEELIRSAADGRDQEPPATVIAMVETRLRGLDDRHRGVLRAASIFGRSFWVGGILALLGATGGDASVAEAIDALTRGELLGERGASRLGGEVELSFRHDTVRDASYGLLTDRDRRAGHALAGAWLEARGETSARVLAEHFDRGDVGPRAAYWYALAAKQALEGNDLAGAIDCAERGLALKPEAKVRGALLRADAEAQRWRGDLKAGAELSEQAAAAFDVGESAWFEAVTELIDATGYGGSYEVALTWAERAGATAATPGAETAKTSCVCQGVMQMCLAGRLKDAGVLAAKVEALATEAVMEDRATAASVWRARAWIAYQSGDLGRGFLARRMAAKTYEEAGNLRSASQEWTNAGHFLMEMGLYGDAESLFRTWLGPAERIGLPAIVANTWQGLGHLLGVQGKLVEGKRALERSLEMGVALRHKRLESWAHQYLARNALLSGDFALAEREARVSLEPLPDVEGLKPVAYATLALALIGQARAGEALALAQAGMDIVETLGGVEEGDARPRLALLEALLATGDIARASQIANLARTKLRERARELGEFGASFLDAVPDHARTMELARSLAPEADLG